MKRSKSHSEGGVIQFDGHRQERFPVVFSHALNSPSLGLAAPVVERLVGASHKLSRPGASVSGGGTGATGVKTGASQGACSRPHASAKAILGTWRTITLLGIA